jgi:uncharacterized protein (DUF362 family)/Pyruvate/2-oxoacid:ferredoxin oxidoreductase delta subunit
MEMNANAHNGEEAARTVSLVRCADYAPHTMAAAVAAALAPLGGWSAFARPGQSALIKPNLLTDRAPEDGVTTHPELARAVIRALKQVGARPWVADSPNSVTKLEKVWRKTGFQALCAEENVPLVNLEKAGAVQVRSGGYAFTVAKPVLEADVIVNLPKVKTHVLTILTAGVKNMYGTVPGFYKTLLHKTYPRPRRFGRLVLEICRKTRPALTLADAVVGMDGDGPSGGAPCAMGFLAAAADPVALDMVLCRILGIRPQVVPYLRPCLGKGRTPYAQTTGEDPDALLTRPVRVPSTFRGQMIPGPLIKLIGRALWIRPSFSDACVRCGRCVAACPAAALSLPERGGTPALQGRLCVGCCCCHEVCPARAVTMRPSPLLALTRGGRPL